jgi:hypothetical protein
MKYRNGLVAGFAGSVMLAIIFILKSMMGFMPELDIIVMLGVMMGMPAIMGWIAHFAIGTVAWGGLFALANDSIPGQSQIAKGVVLGIAAWLLMMIAVMPMAGAGFFGLNFGMMGAIMPLMLHVIFGAVLGFVYARLDQTESQSV